MAFTALSCALRTRDAGLRMIEARGLAIAFVGSTSGGAWLKGGSHARERLATPVVVLAPAPWPVLAAAGPRGLLAGAAAAAVAPLAQMRTDGFTGSVLGPLGVLGDAVGVLTLATR